MNDQNQAPLPPHVLAGEPTASEPNDDQLIRGLLHDSAMATYYQQPNYAPPQPPLPPVNAANPYNLNNQRHFSPQGSVMMMVGGLIMLMFGGGMFLGTLSDMATTDSTETEPILGGVRAGLDSCLQGPFIMLALAVMVGGIVLTIRGVHQMSVLDRQKRGR